MSGYVGLNEFESWIIDARYEHCWTPDVPFLEQQDFWYVFVYNHRRGKHSAYFTNPDTDASFMGNGFTKSAIYSILNVEENVKRVQLLNPLGSDRVLGEIWCLPTEELLELDADERHSLVTKRCMIPIQVASGQTVDCWAYLSNSKYLNQTGVRVSKITSSTYIGTQKFLEVT